MEDLTPLKLTPENAEELRQDIQEAEQEFAEGKFYTIEQVRAMTARMIAEKRRRQQRASA